MPVSSSEMALGLVVITLLALAAYRLKSLDRDGLIAGIVVGGIILAGGGWPGLIIMMVFFAVSAFSTRLRYDYKRRLGFGQEKGGARGWRNTFANGGVAAAAALAGLLSGGVIFSAAFLGAMASSTADTLATEIGLLSRSRPRLITKLRKKVGAGTSGGVTLLGELMAVIGSLLIGIVAVLLGFSVVSFVGVILITLLGGFAGSHFDSLLGATVQGMNRCVVCGVVTEGGIHHGKPTVSVKGVRFIGNNAVNFLSTIMGALVAVAVAYII
ncbi:MAG: DUF92 domain-containing protein [Nitrososphaerales archaeon]